jgi:hypothetical protein
MFRWPRSWLELPDARTIVYPATGASQSGLPVTFRGPAASFSAGLMLELT